MSQEHCQFCHLLSKPDLIIHRDQTLFAFHDISKASAVEHILICPVQHIETVMDVSHPELIIRMKQLGEKILASFGKGDKFRFGFHKGSHISIYHLHLHCFIEPFSSIAMDKIQYGHMLQSVESAIQSIKLRQTPKL